MQSRKFWTPEEDNTLKNIVEAMEPINWTLAAVQFSNFHQLSNRNSKQCRQRWIHHLSVSQKIRSWTVEQQKLMVELFLIHHRLKNKWKVISERLGFELARQPTEVKNRFYALIRRGLRRINNQIGREISPQQIRILKPSTISSMIEKSDDQNSQELVKIIYDMANRPVDEQKTTEQKQTLSNILNKVIAFSSKKQSPKYKQNVESQQSIEIDVEQISKRKYSLDTSASKVEFQNLKNSTRTMYSSQEYYYQDQDIGCFLNIEQADSPVLQFEEFCLPF